MGVKIGADLAGEVGMGRENALVEKDQAAVAARGGFADDGVAQGGVAGRKQIAGEDDGKLVADFDALEVVGQGESGNVEFLDRMNRIYRMGREKGKVFHSMENFFAIFPHNGKNVSTVWKKWERRGHGDFQESLRVTVRLKTGAPGRESGSAVK